MQKSQSAPVISLTPKSKYKKVLKRLTYNLSKESNSTSISHSTHTFHAEQRVEIQVWSRQRNTGSTFPHCSDAGQPARTEGSDVDQYIGSRTRVVPVPDSHPQEDVWLGEDGSTWKISPEGAYNKWGSEGPCSLSRPARLNEVAARVPINIWLVSGSPVIKELHGLPPEITLTEKSDVEVVTLMMARLVSRHLGVPEDCLSFTWRTSYATNGSCTGYNVMMVLVALSDTTWERLDKERCALFDEGGPPYCFVCLGECDDADYPNPRGATRKSNCIECEPCFFMRTVQCVYCKGIQILPHMLTQIHAAGGATDTTRSRID